MSAAAEWWCSALDAWLDSTADHLGDLDAFRELDIEDRGRVAKAVKSGLQSEDLERRYFAWELTKEFTLDELDTAPASDHLRAEIAAAFGTGSREPLPPTEKLLALVRDSDIGDMPEDERRAFLRAMVDATGLEPSAAVPGCPCEPCTGIPEDHPSRLPAWMRRDPDSAAGRLEAWRERCERARSVPILEVAAMLNLGDPKKVGREVAVLCPVHADTRPSCRLDTKRGLWRCDPCAEGGDAIALLMRGRRIDFGAAVRELAP